MMCYSRVILSISLQKYFKIEFSASLYKLLDAYDMLCRSLVKVGRREPFVSCVNQAELVLLAKVITWLSEPTFLSAE
jgi:hypothetical protein